MMDSLGRFIIFCALLHLINRRAPLFGGSSPILLASAQEEANSAETPSDMLRLITPNNDDHNSNNNDNEQQLLYSERKLLELLDGTREKLAKLNPLGLQQCAEFNWTLSQAYEQLARLVELAGDEGGAKLGALFMSELHEQMEAERQTRVLNAYEALGASVSLYFDCIGQLGQLGRASQLENLLPISATMGALSGLVEAAVGPGSGQQGEGGSVTSAPAPDVTQGGAGALMRGLGWGAQQAYERTKDLIGWEQ